VEGSFEPGGAKGEPAEPQVQALHVHMIVAGATGEQAAKLANAFRDRCPIYVALSRAVPIEIETVIQ
jgi:uncharacterized OsmC-like protein